MRARWVAAGLAAAAAAGVLLWKRPRAPSGHVPSGLSIAGAGGAYVEPSACAACHADIARSYRETGMGRSFFPPSADRMVEDFESQNSFEHLLSRRAYRMIRRGDRYFQRRWQTGPGGGINVEEKEIHYVLGSGNHVRSYVHRTPDGRLLQLPVAWYPLKQGHWGMNPGYDRSDHLDFRRRIDYSCMFCHAGYPEIRPGGDSSTADPVFPGAIPEGIDCQRCHGPGRQHVEAAARKAPKEAVQAVIVNPRRLDPVRRLEVCLQCHLETTSRPLPNVIQRYERGVFSFRPGQSLAGYAIHFDHAPGSGHDDKFEIDHAGYRLLQSPCFRSSAGKLGCTACHDPHKAERGDAAARKTETACRGCHEPALQALVKRGHPAGGDCAPCHMPKRRTEDAVHVVMTDHWIQRPKPGGGLLAPRKEPSPAETRYRGEVVPYYPPADPSLELYTAVAQVKQGSNLEAGIPRLERAIELHKPARAEFWFELAEAYAQVNRHAAAAAMYEAALQRDPVFPQALRRLAKCRVTEGNWAAARQALERAIALDPSNAAAFLDLGLLSLREGKQQEAADMLRRATARDPDFAEAHSNLGGVLAEMGDISGARLAYGEALRAQPDLAEAHNNLAALLHGAGEAALAEYHFREAIQWAPGYPEARFNFAIALVEWGRGREARNHLEHALKLRPDMAEAHLLLGSLHQSGGDRAAAARHFREALKSPNPDLHRTAEESLSRLGVR